MQLMMDCAMHTNGDLRADTARKPGPRTPASIWFGGVAVRTIFLIVLIVLTARVASPQIENIWSVFETPGDLIRVALGFAVCVWFIVHLFILPKDAGAYRTWLYLGVAILPLSVLCAFVVW
jgi:TRAP-type C4-dicarboxylate transport system permease small subunit